MKLLLGVEQYNFTCVGLWAEVDVRWLSEATGFTWSFNLNIEEQFMHIDESVQLRNGKSLIQRLSYFHEI